MTHDPRPARRHDADDSPDVPDVRADLAWLINPARARENKYLRNHLTRAYTKVAWEVIPKLLLLCFIVSCALAAVITTFVHFVRWLISLFAVAV